MTPHEKEDLRNLLRFFYGPQAGGWELKESNAEQTEKMIQDMIRCDEEIRLLLSSIKCGLALLSRGGLRKCFKEILAIFRHRKADVTNIFCYNTLIYHRRTKIQLGY